MRNCFVLFDIVLKVIICISNLGVSTCHFAWAFHSEAEEELINMIPAIQRGDPQWSELRAMGIGWWVRNINTLRRCIEKVTLLHWILKLKKKKKFFLKGEKILSSRKPVVGN